MVPINHLIYRYQDTYWEVFHNPAYILNERLFKSRMSTVWYYGQIPKFPIIREVTIENQTEINALCTPRALQHYFSPFYAQDFIFRGNILCLSDNGTQHYLTKYTRNWCDEIQEIFLSREEAEDSVQDLFKFFLKCCERSQKVLDNLNRITHRWLL